MVSGGYNYGEGSKALGQWEISRKDLVWSGIMTWQDILEGDLTRRKNCQNYTLLYRDSLF